MCSSDVSTDPAARLDYEVLDGQASEPPFVIESETDDTGIGVMKYIQVPVCCPKDA